MKFMISKYIIFVPFFGHVCDIFSDEKYCTSFQARLLSLGVSSSCNSQGVGLCGVFGSAQPAQPRKMRDWSLFTGGGGRATISILWGEGHYFMSSILGRAIFKKISLRGGLRSLRL